MNRLTKDEYYLSIALAVSARGTCLRRNYGAVIINNDEIVGTGYTGAPRREANCCDIGYCERDKQNCLPGERYELCRSVHAEMNAVIAAGRKNCIGGTIYISGMDMKKGQMISSTPCLLCGRVLTNAGIVNVVGSK